MVLKNILKILAIFVIGMVGGIFADQILWPYFIERPLFYRYRLEQSPIYVTERKEIFIQENAALRDAVEKVQNMVVGVRSETKTGKIIEGSGLIVTADGLILALENSVPQGAETSILFDGKDMAGKVLQRKDNLALLKIEAANLPTVAFADFGRIKLGERIFLLGVVFEENIVNKIVNEGIIKIFDEKTIQTNIFEESSLQGSFLFNIEGQLVGVNTIDKTGKVSAISIKTIKGFLGF